MAITPMSFSFFLPSYKKQLKDATDKSWNAANNSLSTYRHLFRTNSQIVHIKDNYLSLYLCGTVEPIMYKGHEYIGDFKIVLFGSYYLEDFFPYSLKNEIRKYNRKYPKDIFSISQKELSECLRAKEIEQCSGGSFINPSFETYLLCKLHNLSTKHDIFRPFKV